MSDVATTVVPVFGLIALGYASARLNIISREAGQGVAAFVFTLAMPALLFRTVLTAEAPEASSLALLAGFMGAAGGTWALASIATTRLLKRPAADAPSIAMASTFGNTVMMGIPLVVGHYGDRALAPLAVIIALHAPIMWAMASLQFAAARNVGDGQSVRGVAVGIARDLAQNPILIGIAAGWLWRLTGFGLAETADRFISLLAQAGVPGALVALGLSLARYNLGGQLPTLAVINATKLLLMPALAFAICAWLLGLSPLATGVVVILAACPTGANAFLFASKYDTAVGSVSASVALGTALSAITVTALLAVLGPA